MNQARLFAEAFADLGDEVLASHGVIRACLDVSEFDHAVLDLVLADDHSEWDSVLLAVLELKQNLRVHLVRVLGLYSHSNIAI